ncbi:PAS domain S-box protein [Moorena sp. SIOASIH]|uniref:PAS domain S-box protein n=1 Tax=Moorena sp. SIOASIH TaxID=2607817 RepID=UPI0025D10038|nr:PAS domain S-box protein [Moorena sp. SIOASIH]
MAPGGGADEPAKLAAQNSYKRTIDPELQQAFDDVTALAAQICQTPMALITLIDSNSQWCQSNLGLDETSISQNTFLSSHRIESAEVLVVEDTLADQRFAAHPLVTAEPHIRFYAGVPLITSEGYALGTLAVMDQVPKELQPQQLGGLQALSRQLISQLELKQQLADLQQPQQENQGLENELPQVDQELLDFLENGCVGLHCVDSNGIILWANQAELDLLGYNAQEYIGHHIAEFYPEQEVIEDILARLTVKQTLKNYEARLLCKDGSIRHVLINSNVLWKNGKFVHTRCFTRDITEWKRIQEERDRFFDLSIDLLCIAGFDGYFKRLSPSFTSTLGYTEAELKSTTFLDFVHPDDRGSTRAEIEQLGTGIPTVYFENRYRCQDGSYKWLAWAANPVVNDGLIYAIARDITEAKQKQASLEESEARFRMMADHAPVMIWMSGTDKLYNFFNQLWLNFTGNTLELELGNGWAEGVHPDDLEYCFHTYVSAFDARENFRMEYRLRRRDGQYRWILDIGTPRFTPNGDFAGYIGSCIDITERKQAEEALRRQGLIVESIFDGIIITDLAGKIIDWNPASERIFGYTKAEVLGKTAGILHRPEEAAVLTEQIIQGMTRSGRWSGEIHFIRKDGRCGVCETVVVPLYDQQDNIVATIGLNHDITERQQNQHKLYQSEARYRAIVEDQTELICRFRPDGTLTFVNGAYCRYFSKSEKELIGQRFLPLIPDEDLKRLEQCITSLSPQNPVETVEHRVIMPTGEIRWQQWSDRAIFNEQGQLIELQAVGRDITEHKHADEQLLQKSQALETFSNNLKHLHRLNTTNYQNFELLYADYLETGCKILGMPTGIISQVHLNSYTILSVRSDLEGLVAGSEFELKNTYCAVVVREKKTIAYTHVGDMELMHAHPVYQTLKLESYIGTPIFVYGEVYGSLNFSSTQVRERDFQPHEREIVELMAQSLGRLIAAHQAEIERQQAEAALLESESTLRSFFNSSALLMGVVELVDDDILHISDNNSTANFFGTTPEAMQNRLASELGAPKTHIRRWITHYRESQQSNQPISFEYDHTTETDTRWLCATVCPITDTTTPRPRFSYVVDDITDRKLAEQELQRQNQRSQLFSEITLKIRQSLQLEQILQTAVTEVQQFLKADRVVLFQLSFDGWGKVVQEAVVPGWPIMLGQSIEDPCFHEEYLEQYRQGRVSNICDLENSDIRACHVEMLQQFRVKANLVVPIQQQDKLWGLLIAHQCANPRQWTNFESELLQQLADQIAIALAQAQLLGTETRQRQELARSNAELQQFAYVASHDLQEPLRKIQAFGDRLQTKYHEQLTEQGQDYLKRMQNAAGRMQVLINDLLSLSRVTTKAKPLVATDLAQVVQEVLSDLELRIQQSGGVVEVGELHTIEADPLQMRQLLQNLISNGLKFRPEPRGNLVKIYSQLLQESVPLSYGGATVNERCQIIVEDNGIGFDPRYRDRIFQTFQRLHGRSEYEGTGIGLAICRRIVERHNGSIMAESIPGQGARFIVRVPIKQS